jgi:hypothetical protein
VAVRALLALLPLLSASPAIAQTAPGDPPTVKLAVGDAVDVCKLARCPTSGVFCDDASLVRIEHVEGTVKLRGEKAGATLCGIQQSDTTRRVFRVVVEAGVEEKE